MTAMLHKTVGVGLVTVGLSIGLAAPSEARSTETGCENAKLRAAGAYARCLAHAAQSSNNEQHVLSPDGIERCNVRFDHSFNRAEAYGACRTAGGPATLRGPILRQAQETLAATTSGPGCPSTPTFDEDTSSYTCTLKSGSAIDLAAVVSQIDDPQVTSGTVVWIEAWGANGGAGNTDNGGTGGSSGYAQFTTTVTGLLDTFGTSEIYYYLGVRGAGPSANSGGDGGTGSIVTTDNLTDNSPGFNESLLVAGGGGGGGAGRGTVTACQSRGENLDILGGSGGVGGTAIATLNTDAFVRGARGGARRNVNESGSGGGGDAGGSGGTNGSGSINGDSGFAVLGGGGGGRMNPTTGFFDQSDVKISKSGGTGGAPGNDAGGGGGGGGYGGGAGGFQGEDMTGCVSGGGGGGGSFAIASTTSCPRTRPTNPNGDRGAVQIVFDAGSC